MTAAGRRGVVDGLASPHPLGAQLPGLYLEDGFVQRLTEAFDDVLAPVFSTLDSLWAYLDPTLAPPDFLEWLAEWVGVSLDENWPLERRRDLVAGAAGLYARRGTAHALAQQVQLYAGVVPEIEESGGVATSATAGGAVPGLPEPRLVVRVRVPDPSAVDARRLDAIVAESKPAHVPHQVEVLPR